ncbi:I78 family peptidase inhibitor [Maricaulis parjimensis]|uniref:I78 family peptidase inhibitor n=1 Tax=Maricaulis parjimensis TaxID=144023 RepID=UPI00193A6B66|nr:I78 family peptidase inhibitor [Maricaulis parjimensis]
MKHAWILPLALLGLAACSATGNGIPDTGNALDQPVFDGDALDGDHCGAQARAYLIGQAIGEVDLDSLAGNIRVIRPGDAVTMDHRPDRLNLDLDADDVILRPWCG